MLTSLDRNLLRYSLIFVWLATALVSVVELHGQSAHLLSGVDGLSPPYASYLILGGASVDAVLGLAMLFRPTRSTYLSALMVMLAMTLFATFLMPILWLNPLGPLTKNIPITAVLLVLARKPA